MEIWRKIDGFSQYEVSNMGNIRNIITGKNIKPQPTGYKWKYLTEYLADLLEQIQDEDMKNERVA